MSQKFSLAKNRIGAYFSDGQSIIWHQTPSLPRTAHGGLRNLDPALERAVRAARREFDRVYWKEKNG